MNYRIEIQPEAEQEIEEAYLWISEKSSENARRWRERLLKTLQTLTQNPDRCPLATEQEAFTREVRELLFGKRRGVYRILFSISDDVVSVLHFRHAARKNLNE